MPQHPPRRSIVASALSLVMATAIGVAAAAPAHAADPPAASAFGAQISAAGQEIIPPTPLASVPTRPGEDIKSLVDIPADPVAISGTLTAEAAAHATADLASKLTVVEQTFPGPYDARSVAEIEDAGVLLGVAGPDVPVLTAGLIRAEAVAVCAGTPRYSANSEVIDLAVAGQALPLNAPVQQIVDAISGVLAQSGLNAVVDVQRNVVTQLPGGGAAVDALVVTVLAAAGEAPLAQVRLAHAEVTAGACAAVPQCTDGVDNDGDTKSDIGDPGCHRDGNAANEASFDPNDNDERDGVQCADGVDNDGDTVSDRADPGCHTDGRADNDASYDANDDNENDVARAGTLPATGASFTMLPALAALSAGVAAVAARRRLLR